MTNARKWCKQLGLSCVSVFMTCGLVYTGWLMVRSWKLYDYARTNPRAGVTPIYKADPVLGYVHVPNSRGFECWSVEPKIPDCIDADGFRIPPDDQGTKHRPLILALGCSFTYGTGCLAENTYSHKLAQLLGGSEINAGVSGYGLAQMVLLAERLIPKYKPDYVVVQYSWWLADRSMQELAPTSFILQPAPYFTTDDEGLVEMNPPLFETAAFRANLAKYYKTRKKNMRFILFAAKVGLPVFIHDDWNYLQYRLRALAGQDKRPAQHRGQVITYAYRMIKNLCAENHSSLIVAVLGNDQKREQIPSELTKLNLSIVDTQAALHSRLDHDDQKTFERVYETFDTKTTSCFTGHPNALANSIIAQALASRILKENETSKTSCCASNRGVM